MAKIKNGIKIPRSVPAPKGPLDKPDEIDGQALEGLMTRTPRTWIKYKAQEMLYISGTPLTAWKLIFYGLCCIFVLKT